MDSVAQLTPGLADDQRPRGSVTGVTIPPSCDHGPPVNRPSLVQPADGRSLLSTSVGMTLVAAGAILRFAVTAMFAHVAGVMLMLAGIVALLLSLLVWGPLSRRRSRSGGRHRDPPPVARPRTVYRQPVAAETGSPRWPEGGEARFCRAISAATSRRISRCPGRTARCGD